MTAKNYLFLGAATVAALVAAPAAALGHSAASQPAYTSPSGIQGQVSGGSGSLTYQAQSLLVGMTPTGNTPSPGIGGGGDSLFFPASNKSGVLALIIDYGSAGRFICTGSLLSDRMSVLTAAHCINGNPLSVTAYVFEDPNVRTPFNGREVAVTHIFEHADYTGDVIDHNDIAVLRLEHSIRGVDAYDLYDGTSLTGLDFNVAGYGGRSTVGGTLGVNAGTGFLREGDNTYDFRLGDPLFGSVWSSILGEPMSQISHSYISDFDNGLAANDASCRITAASNFGGLPGTTFCDLGVGAREVGVAGGDSGGPQFVNGQISGVNSYGLTFGTAWGDCRAAVPPSTSALNSSCGEFSGYVPVYIHKDFIAGAMAVPEPATWGMMIAGFGLVGFAARRRSNGVARVTA